MATGMLCIKLMYKKAIHILSTLHRSVMVWTERENLNREFILKPQAVIDYNEDIKGADVVDLLASYYPAVRRSLKWYKKVFIYPFNMAMTNALLLFKLVGLNIRQQLIFREVVRGLLLECLPQPPKYDG